MIKENIKHNTKWTIHKYQNEKDYQQDKAFEVSEFEGNILLNEGIAVLQNLLIGEVATAYDNTESRLGVGDSSAEESAAHTTLQAETNKAWVGMEATYPAISGQKTTWRAIFDGDTGNFDWKEFTVVNAANDAGDNLNRKVSDQGTKVLGQIWTLDLEITWS